MKRILFFFLCAISFLCANAQIHRVNASDLLGKWSVGGTSSQFPVLYDREILGIEFNDVTGTVFTMYDEYGVMQNYGCDGFWLGGDNAMGEVTLNILSNNQYCARLWVISFVIDYYDKESGTMNLTSLDKTRIVTLYKVKDSGVEGTRADITDGQAYSLDGAPVNSTDFEGVFIQDGKKKVKK